MEKHSFCFPEEPFFLSNCDCRMFYLQVWACAQLGKGKEVVIPVCGSVAAQQCGCTIKEEQLHLTSDRLLFLLNFVFLEKKHIGRSEWPGIWVEEIGAFVTCQLWIGAMQAVLSIAIIRNCWEQSLGSHRGDRDVPGFLYASLRSKLDFIIVLFKRNVFLNIMVCCFFFFHCGHELGLLLGHYAQSFSYKVLLALFVNISHSLLCPHPELVCGL